MIFQELDKNYNDIENKYNIALMYYQGDGVKVNLEKAYELFYEFVNKYNDKPSFPILAEMYYYGRGTERNYAEAENIVKCMKIVTHYFS